MKNLSNFNNMIKTIQLTKKCSKCKVILSIDMFYVRKGKYHYPSSRCKKCDCLHAIELRQTPKGKEYAKKFWKIYKRPNLIKHKEYQKVYEKIRRSNDSQYKLRYLLRLRIYLALKGNFKKGSSVRDLGCTIPELKIHIQNKFVDGMDWNNHGKWHLDHIKPLSKFNLTNREEFLIACHYTNLQPLWAKDNLIKSNKIICA